MSDRKLRGAPQRRSASRSRDGTARPGERPRLPSPPARVGESADAEAVVQETLRTTVELLEADSGSLYRWEAASGQLRCVSTWGLRGERATEAVSAGQGLVGQAFYRGRPLIVNDYQHWELALPGGRAGGLRAGLGVPLSRGGKLLGVLLIRSYQPGASFSDDDAHLVALLGDQAAAALLTTEAFEQQRRAASRGQVLLRLARHFAEGSDPEQVLSDLLAEAVALIGGDDGMVSRWDQARQGLVTLRYLGREVAGPSFVWPGQGITGRAVQQWSPVIVNDYQRECGQETRSGLAGARASVAVPLHHDGRLLGALAVHSYAPDKRFTAEDAEVLELLAGIVSATIGRLERVRLDGVLLAVRTVQHELKNRLARTSGYAELLLRDPDLPPHLREAARQIGQGVDSAVEVLDQLGRITHLEEKLWGPTDQPTIDLARSARGAKLPSVAGSGVRSRGPGTEQELHSTDKREGEYDGPRPGNPDP